MEKSFKEASSNNNWKPEDFNEIVFDGVEVRRDVNRIL